MKQRTTKPATPAAPVSVEKAKPDWLPLHIAALRFFPAHAATAKAFEHEIAQLVARFASSAEFRVSEVDPYVVRVAFGGVGLVFDAAKGEIEIEADVVGDEWETVFVDYVGIRARENSFPMVFPEENIKLQFREAARRQHELAVQITISLSASFKHAVANGAAEIFGRWRDLQSPFQPVYPDQWPRLGETPGADRSPGTDVSTITTDGRRGELTIFSIHVCPHRKQESASNLALMQCTAFLSQRMNASPDRILFETLRIEVRKRWKLPDRTVSNIYRDIKKSIKSPGWHTRGPVASLVQRTG